MYVQQPANAHICSLAYCIFFTLKSQTQFSEREREKIVEKGKCGQMKRRVKKETTMENKKGKRPAQRGMNKNKRD